MVRLILSVIVGFFSWMVLWIGFERAISAVWPAFGEHQAAFQAAIENGGAFTAIPTMLVVHIVLALFVSMVAGYLSALIAGSNKTAPLVVGILLLIMGVLKIVMSWQYVPVWYHIVFTAVLLPMAIIGGRLKGGKQ